MKKFFILFAILTIAILNVNAVVRTVSNNPDIPAQYNNLQTAIDASAAGDTILVSGSATTYGDVTIRMKLVLFGAGYNNPYGYNSIINYLYLVRQNASIGASGSKLSGFYIQYYTYLQGSFTGGTPAQKKLENVVIERCRIYYISWNQSDVTYNNDTIRNCLFQSYYMQFTNASYTNVIIHNNIFDSYYLYQSSGSNLSSVFFRNNVVLNENTNFFSSSTSRITNMVVENSIFYDAEPQGCYGCTFNNNITYLNSNDAIPGLDNSGSGNLTGTDPQFTSYPPAGGGFSYSRDFTLKSTSPGIDAGTDNSDIGMTGGLMPYTPGANPRIPQMTEVKFPDNASSVKTGGTLNVSFKAKKQD
jgi:hypothetical protein